MCIHMPCFALVKVCKHRPLAEETKFDNIL